MEVLGVESSDVFRVEASLNKDDLFSLTAGNASLMSKLSEGGLSYPCPKLELVAAMNLIGGKWKALIICELSRRSMRYGEIDSALSEVSHRILTYELQALLKGGVIEKSKLSEGGHQYSLTAGGEALHKIIQDLIRWARMYETVFDT